MARKRTGCIYVEVQRNTGKSNNGGGLYQPRYIRGVGRQSHRNETLVQSHLDRRGEGVEEVLRRLKIAEASNEKARQQMKRELEAGAIRFMTVTEKLIAQARGHEDNEATHAARRCLAKRGIAL